jgi:hypothetical protein
LCIECDDEELLAVRKAATLAITGSPNGRCDKCYYFDAIMKNWRAFVQEYEHHQNEGATGPGGDDEDDSQSENTNAENDDDYTNSQDAFNTFDDHDDDKTDDARAEQDDTQSSQ